MAQLRDFRDKNKDMVTMFKGTDKTHIFSYVEDTGSKFIWNLYDVICEGRLANMNEVPDFLFPVTEVEVDDESKGMILFLSEKITSSVRESKVYWRVVAKRKDSGLSKVINYGEILLREF